jgi:tetratricopeptide (TPR) repeat protein
MAITFLLVDDDPIARKTIEEILTSDPRLRDLEINVEQSLDAPKALARVAGQRPELVLTDLSVQGMDGFAFCGELRRLAAGHPMGLVVMSAVYKDTRMIGPLLEELRATFVSRPLQPQATADALFGALPPTARVVPSMGLTSDVLMAVTPAMVAARLEPERKPEPEPDERGSLADHAVAKLLFDLIDARSTGTLVLTRAQMRKEIFLRGGRAVAADSNLRQEALGSLLVAKKVIDDQQLEYLLAETKSRGQKMGTVLVELGWMTPEDVLQYLAAQARKRISDCLRWQEGNFAFTRGDTFGERVMEHDLDTPKIIFTGLYRTAVADDLVVRFDEDGARPIRLLSRFEPYRTAFQAVFGEQILEPLHGGTTLGELVLRDDGKVLALAVEALLTAGLAELLGSARSSAHSRPTAEIFTLERLGNELSLNPPGPDPADESTHQELDIFGPDSGSVELEFQGSLSGKVELHARPPSETDIKVAPRVEDDPRTALLREYLELHGKSHYQVLGLGAEASPGQVEEAYQSKLASVSEQALGGLAQEADKAKFESLRAAYDRAHKALSDPDARTSYDSAQMPAAAPAADALGAELAFREGTALLERGQGQEAIASFERAVAGRPDQAAYHAYLGWAHFLARGLPGARAANERLSHALALDPDLAKAHEILGRIAVKEEDSGTARRHLERALELEPAQPELLELLIGVFEGLQDFRGAERCYRRMIAGLGEGAPALRARLWRVLAQVYEVNLNQAESARVAYETAARLSPNDVELQRKVVELDGENPERWRESARALVAEWQQRPTDGALGERLVTVFQNADKQDAATLAAAAVVLRGGNDRAMLTLAQKGRPTQLRPVSRPLDAELRQRLAFPGEDDEIEKLVGALASAGIIERVSDIDLGIHEAPPVLPDQMPATFRRVLRYVSDTLRMKEPSRILLVPKLENDARIADARPQALLVGPELLKNPDAIELIFRLGRTLALYSSGRVAAVARTGRHLRPAFLAAVTLARGANASPEPDVDDLMKRIMATSTVHKLKIMDTAGRLLRARRSMDISRWSRALVRTGTRIGLLLSGDLLRVGRAVDAEEGAAALDDLISFALSAEHLELRDQLGLSSA